MAKKQSGLGKGLGALMLENNVDDMVSTSTLPINEIIPNKEQPRKTFDEGALQELADSITVHGVLQPLLHRLFFRPLLSGGYQLIAGERRWRASRMAGLKEVPVIIRELSDSEAMEIAIIENLQREDLNPIEEAEGLQALIDKCDYTQEEQVAVSVGKPRPAIANALRLLKLPEEVRQMTKEGEISAGHARALLAFDNQAIMYEVAKQIVSDKLTVRDVERLAKRPTKSADKKQNAKDIKFLRENPEAVKENIKKKFQDHKLPYVDEVIELDSERRQVIARADELRANRNKISKQIGALMAQGKKEEGMALKEQVTVQAKELDELAKKHFCGRRSQSAGNGFYYLMGDIARLHSAVLAYARDFMIDRGFTYCIPPYMIRSNVVTGVTFILAAPRSTR